MVDFVAVRILVDSTADIPAERARELGIEVVPITVLFGDEEFQDGVNLTGREFYSRLVNSPVMPATATPSPALFEDAYHKLIREGATGILALHIGSELSASYNVSHTAAETVSGETGVPIVPIDTRQVSGGFGIPAEILAREARDGASLDQLVAQAKSLLSRVRLVALVDTLEYLQRGGRIGRGKAMLGTLLNVKPLIEIRDSQVVPLEQVRTRNKALERLGQIMSKLGPLEAVGVVQSDDAIGVQIMGIVRTFWNGPVETFALGPAVGTHAGPGAGGIVVLVRE